MPPHHSAFTSLGGIHNIVLDNRGKLTQMTTLPTTGAHRYYGYRFLQRYYTEEITHDAQRSAQVDAGVN
jgi:hypothetical protein